MKHIFHALAQKLPGKVMTSRFFGTDVPGYAYRKYDWLEMRLQENAVYDVRGFYGIRDATFDNTVATGLSLKEGLELLRHFEDTMMNASKFDQPGDKPGYMFDFVLTKEDFLKKRGRSHVDFIGPRHGVTPEGPLTAARLCRIRALGAGAPRS